MKAIKALLSSLFLCVLMASSSYANTNNIKLPEKQGISLEYAFNLPIYGICSDYVGAIDYFRKR